MIIYLVSDQFWGIVLDKTKVVSYIEEKFSLNALQSFSCEQQHLRIFKTARKRCARVNLAMKLYL